MRAGLRAAASLLGVVWILPCAAFAAGDDALAWEDAVREAAAANPDLAVARAAVRRSAESLSASYTSFLPQASAAASYTESDGGRSFGFSDRGTASDGDEATDPALNGGGFGGDGHSYGVSVRQSLFSGFRNTGEVERAAAALAEAKSSLDSARAQVTFDLRNGFLELLYAQAQRELVEAIAGRREANVDLVELRYEGGREHKGSFLRSEAAWRESRFDVDRSFRELAVARARLARALGRPAGIGLRVAGTLEAEAPATPPDLDALVLATPAHATAGAQLAAAEAAIRVARSGFFPSFDAVASYSRRGDVDGSDDTRTAGVTLSFPFFPGGRTFFDVRAAEAEAARLRQNLRRTDAETRLGLETALASLVNAVENVGVRRQFLEASEVRAEIARAQYTNGLISFIDWDLIENERIEAQTALLAGRREAARADAQWQLAQGKAVVR